MGQSVAIQHQAVRLAPELSESRKNGRCLPKGKQARNIGEGQFSNGHMLFENGPLFEIPQHDGGDALYAALGKGAVRTGYETNGSSRPAHHDTSRELLLDGDRLPG
jgi:hypothetical protein